MLVLNRAETESLLDLDALRQAVAAAMADVSAGRASMPARIASQVEDRGALLAAMPAYLPGLGGLGAKLVSLFPHNAGGPVPTHQAVVVMFDHQTGSPVGLVDGTSITAARTAAGSALSTELIAPPGVRTLAILGTGVQARAHAVAVVRTRPFEEVRIAGRRQEGVQALADDLKSVLPCAVVTAGSYAEACAGADVVCATTHSPDPVVRLSYLEPAAHVTSVGYNVAGQEVDSETVAAAVVVVESRAAALAPPPTGSPDLRIPIEEGLIGPDHIYAEIGELVTGSRPLPVSGERITLYKSVGVAAQDIAAALLVLERAAAAGVGTTVAL
ncbi:MAG: ornithine cyclodeaminase family protein [Actinomycetota bacterium]|nr:ornithine cyclodeaminase family protein [Actinomycetota bacterium]